MSFSSETKNEIVSGQITKMCCAKAELMAFLCFDGRIKQEDTLLYIASDNAKVAKRVYSLIKYVFGIVPRISVAKSQFANYSVYINDEKDILKILTGLNFLNSGKQLSEFISFRADTDMLKKKCCKRAFVRGAFLSSGSLMHPEKNYHLEFVTHRSFLKSEFVSILKKLGLSPKTIVRKSHYVMYFKNSEEIADILNIIGAHNSLMEFYNVRILKDMRNNINRQVNCETANLDKTVKASLKHVESIEKLKENGVLDTLPENLKEIAYLRLEYREKSLTELGQMLKVPIGKSGVNHRLRKILEISEKY